MPSPLPSLCFTRLTRDLYRIQSISGYPPDKLPYSSLILVEPTVFTREVCEQLQPSLTRIKEFARTRQDVWPDGAAAREWFAGQLPWSRWDPRVLDLYVVRIPHFKVHDIYAHLNYWIGACPA